MKDNRWRYGMLFGVAGAFILGLALHDPIPQDASYHAFADRRAVLGIPNFWNVASSLPFLAVGIAGLRALGRGGAPGRRALLYPAYATFFAGAILICFGSAYYHLDPDNESLLWDRLPITIAFMALVAIILGESINAQLGRWCLPLLVLLGMSSVLYWRFTELGGHGDLRPYVLVQFLPMAMVPLVMLLFPPASLKVSFIWGMLGAYAVAKVLEFLDVRTYLSIRVLSGHTLKHMVAAAGMYFLVLAVRADARSADVHPMPVKALR